MRTIITTVCTAFLCVAILTTGARAQGTLVLGTSIFPPLVDAEDGTPGFLQTLGEEAFRRIGYDLRVANLPSERALVNANEGIDDGNLFRIAGLEKLYPNLIQVPEKFFESEFVAYAIDKKMAVDGWKGLEGRDVSYITGWKVFDANVLGARTVEKVRSAEQMFGLLEQRRTEFALYERWQGLWLVRKMGIPGVEVVEPPLATTDMYMYLHKKHAAIVPRLAAALKAMKADGTYRRIFDETLGKL